MTHRHVAEPGRSERDALEREARQREILENLPVQTLRVTAEGHVVQVFMPTPKLPMVPPFPPLPMGRHVDELLPAYAAQLLLKCVADARQSNMVTGSTFHLTHGNEEREYEVRVVPLAHPECLVSVRDRTAEQWAPLALERTLGNPAPGARIARENPYGLTFREVAVLELMAEGAADKEIALRLGVSVFTVHKHVSKVLHKMGVSSRTEASLRTVREHLFG